MLSCPTLAGHMVGPAETRLPICGGHWDQSVHLVGLHRTPVWADCPQRLKGPFCSPSQANPTSNEEQKVLPNFTNISATEGLYQCSCML